jgi:ribonuclease HII
MAVRFKQENPKKLAPATLKQQMLKQLICSDAPEQALRYRGAILIAGIDEVGRGALWGPVVAAAVILPKSIASLAKAGLTDSKQLTREDRERLDKRIRRIALAIAIAEIDAETIDRINIYQATRQAMLNAIRSLPIQPDHLLIDAMQLDHPCPQTRLFYGDSLSLSIAAASVIAKVHRDALCRDLHETYPQYGLASHKGYATPEHRKALREYGPTPLHRRSFAPVRSADPDQALKLELESGELFFDDALLLEAPAEVAWA